MDRTSSLAVTMMLAILGGSSRAALAFVAPCASGLISSSTSRSILASSSSRAAAADQAGGGGVRRFQRSVTARMAADGDAVSDDDFNADLSTKTAFLFPGQGAQYVGMASTICDEVPRAKEMFDTAKEILGYDLLDRCQNGPKELLDSTEVSQPAIFVCSMAAVEKLRMELGEDVIQSATCAVGLSLGEYSALCFAGAMSFEDGVKVTKARGEAMQAASDATDGGMVSVIGLDSDKVKELCVAASEQSGESVSLANFLCNGNYAVSGSKKACDVIEQIAKPDFGARMCVRLAVAGAFHTEFMAAAVEPLGKVLDEISIVKPRIPVLSNVDVLGHSDPKVIKENLKKQVTNPVRWEESMKLLLDNGFEKGFECGPGKVVAGIMKRIDRKALIEGVEV